MWYKWGAETIGNHLAESEWTTGVPSHHPLQNRAALSQFELQQSEGPLIVKAPQRWLGSLKLRQHMEALGLGADPGPVDCGLNSRTTGMASLKIQGSGVAPFSPGGAFRNGRHLGISQFSLWYSPDLTKSSMMDHYCMNHLDFFSQKVSWMF